MEYEYKIRKINRINSRTAPFRQHWCHRCDRSIVAADARCYKCGFREKSKRIKNFGPVA